MVIYILFFKSNINNMILTYVLYQLLTSRSSVVRNYGSNRKQKEYAISGKNNLMITAIINHYKNQYKMFVCLRYIQCAFTYKLSRVPLRYLSDISLELDLSSIKTSIY
jgi:hypothetical protein